MIQFGLGGANTQTGAIFEGNVDLVTFLKTLQGYECLLNPNSKGKSEWYDIFFQNEFVASSFKKHALYNYLELQNIICEHSANLFFSCSLMQKFSINYRF